MKEERLEDIVKQHGTPVYVYDFDKIKQQYQNLEDAFANNTDNFSINYAVKANPNPEIVSLLAEAGAGFDCASRAELELGLENQSPENILFTAPFAPKEELKLAAEKGVAVNFNSIQDLERAPEVPERASFRIDPGIGKGDFGLALGGGSKFGVEEDKAVEAYRKARERGVERFGIHMMTGSGILEPEYFGKVTRKLVEIAEDISDELGIEFEFIDVGGGLGIPYRPEEDELNVEKAVSNIVDAIEESGLDDPEIMMEPGRYLVAQSGTLVGSVNGVMEKSEKTYVGLDTGMHHFLRPMLYDAYHEITVLNSKDEKMEADIVGLVCENTDTFAEDREISRVEEGDLLAIHDVGAYGFAMASNWNTRPLPSEVAVENGDTRVVRKPQDWKDVFHGTEFSR